MDLFTMSEIDNLKLKLDRDLVFFDIESTGLNVLKDRIVQIALIKLYANDSPQQELEFLINPGIPISAEAMEVHGITPDMIRDKPHFKEVAQSIFDFIGDADLAGYNSDRFDIPMLCEELARCELDLDIDIRKVIDVQKIFYKMEPRTLKAALRLYCNEDLEDAHDALADVRATIKVLKGQITKYQDTDYIDGDGFVTKTPIKNNIDSLFAFTRDHRVVDYTQRLRRNYKGEIIFNFGKYMNQKVEDVFRRDKNYYHWILQKDFSSQVKKIVKNIMEKLNSESKQ